MLSKIKAFLTSPIMQKAEKAFLVAAVPLLIAGYAAHGVAGLTSAVFLSAVIAGGHAVVHALGWTIPTS